MESSSILADAKEIPDSQLAGICAKLRNATPINKAHITLFSIEGETLAIKIDANPINAANNMPFEFSFQFMDSHISQ